MRRRREVPGQLASRCANERGPASARQVGRDVRGAGSLGPRRPVGNRVRAVRALAVHGEVNELAKLAGQVLDHAASTPRAGTRGSGGQPSRWHLLPLAHHGDAAGRHYEAALQVMLLVHADLRFRRDDHVLDDGVLHDGAATDLDVVKMTDCSTRDQLLTRTSGDSTASRTSPPETIAVADHAVDRSSPLSCTNLASGGEGTRQDRPLVVIQVEQRRDAQVHVRIEVRVNGADVAGDWRRASRPHLVREEVIGLRVAVDRPAWG